MYTINSWLIFALILCATAIAITAILCDYCVDKKSIETNKGNNATETNGTNNTNNSNEFQLSKRIIKIHRNYIAGFLGFAIIMLLTAQFGRSYNAIYNYLSFASTITSLVLSILAIFVTVHSSADLYKQFTRIDSATETVQNASDQIGKTLTAIQNTESELKKTSTGINSQMNSIVDEFEKRLNERIDKNEMTMRKLLDKNFTNTVSQGNNKQGNNQGVINKNNFLKESSTFGLYGLYACALSKEKNRSFELSDFFNDFSDQTYTFGFLVAISSMGLLQFKDFIQFNTPLIAKSTYFGKIELLTAIKERINREKKNDNKDLLIKLVDTINDFFEEDHLEIEDEAKE